MRCSRLNLTCLELSHFGHWRISHDISPQRDGGDRPEFDLLYRVMTFDDHDDGIAAGNSDDDGCDEMMKKKMMMMVMRGDGGCGCLSGF